MGISIDETGNRYNRLLVVRRSHNNKHNSVMWECLCDCGKTKIIHGCSLRNGLTTSCGCVQLEFAKKVNRTHGNSSGRSKMYGIYASMIRRCHNPDHEHYNNYGGRGIFVCDEWRNDYWQFVRDMGDRPQGLTLDRIDGTKGYNKDNCRWADRKLQGNNRRDNIHLEYNGVKKTVGYWAQETGIKHAVILARIKYGWPAEKILNTQVKTKARKQ